MNDRQPTLLLAAAAALVALLGAAAPVGAQPSPTPTPTEEHAGGELGTYERQALAEALAQTGLEVAPDPEGKTVDEVHVVTLEVFGADTPPLLRWLNRFHWTSAPEVIRRRVLVEPGEPWQLDKAEETERLLRDPFNTSLVVVVPVVDDDPGQVDVLVVTRDIWSLRLNSSIEYQDGQLVSLYLAVSENNFLGRQKVLAGAFDMGLGSFTLGPRYRDTALLGTELTLDTYAGLVFERDGGGFEGTFSQTALAWPFWSLDQDWAAALTVAHSDRIERRFQGTELLPYDDPETPRVEAEPQRYRLRHLEASATLTRSLGESVKHRVSAGWRFADQRAELTEDFTGDAGLRQAFRDDVLPRSERVSGPVLTYRFFVPEWVTYRDIATYDLPEDERIGPYVLVEAAPSLTAVGAEHDFLSMTTAAGWFVDIARDGYLWLEATSTRRFEDGDWIDNEYGGVVQVATPPPWQLFRLVGRARVDAVTEDTQNRLFFAGGLNGLRGYRIGAFAGQARWLGNLELRTLPWKVWITRAGLIAFWDVGDTAGELGELRAHHDVGLGLRAVLPWAQTYPLRVDYAFRVDQAGLRFPGRLSVGFRQVF